MATKKKWELEEEEELEAHKASRPTYASRNQGAMDALAEQVLQRKEFSYDPKGDPMYRQMVDQYLGQGKLAMQDTLARGQTMTGGYGNSYAQSAAQQTYQGYLQQAADRAPEYYRMAREDYDRQGQALLDRYGLLVDQEEADYGRYLDSVEGYYRELDRLQAEYDRERDFRYQLERDQAEDRKWLADYAEKLRQNNLKKNIRKLTPEQARLEQAQWWDWWAGSRI